MIKQNIFLTFLLTFFLTNLIAQKSVNQFDTNGKRHGLWTKNYHQTNQKRYEGVFRHGKEIDSFKYYRLNKGKSVLSAVKVFNEKDSLADVTFYASNKKVISKGKMNGKRYIGQWIYYHKNSTAKMTVENYSDNGELNGERIVYYLNGTIAEQSFYKNGKLDGEAKWFTEKNKLIRSSRYKNGELNGKTINYDADGNIKSEGNYINDQKKGIWVYYKDGKETKKIDHTIRKVISKKQ